jgi:DNA-directed RNA polymerase beta' subunit
MVIRLHIVPPPCIRPSNFIGEAKVRSENDLTIAIQDIVRTNVELEQCIPKDVMHMWDKLQIMVSGLVIHTIKKDVGVKLGLLPNLPATAKQNPQDMKKRLSGKRGRFRGKSFRETSRSIWSFSYCS